MVATAKESEEASRLKNIESNRDRNIGNRKDGSS
jgi:hypothetical protein